MSHRSLYPKEVRQRAIRTVSEALQRLKTAWAAMRMVASGLRMSVDQGDRDSDVSSATSAFAEPSASTEENGSNKPVALDPLDENRLKERISELFPAGYQTLMAIVQGVALVVLLDEGVKNEVFFSKMPFSDRLTAAAQALAVFAAIVIITHRYFLLTALARWRPTMIDTLLPYLLGASEVATALLIGHHAGWWIALSVLFLAATASFVNTLMHAIKPAYGNLDKIYTNSRSAVKRQLIACTVLMFFSACIALITIYSGPLTARAYIICICGIIIAFVTVAIIGERGRNKAFSSYGIPDRHGRIDKDASLGTLATPREVATTLRQLASDLERGTADVAWTTSNDRPR